MDPVRPIGHRIIRQVEENDAQRSQITAMESNVDEVKEIMTNVAEQTMQRQFAIENLHERTEALQAFGAGFETVTIRHAGEIRQQPRRLKNLLMRLALYVFIFLAVMLLLAMLWGIVLRIFR